MENEKNIGEQPISQKIENAQNDNVEKSEIGATCQEGDNGSLGKFKDTQSLLNAYNNLQAEFTKKCQKISELSKSMQDLENDKKQNLPVFASECWQENVSNFLSKNSGAQKYSGEIANEILQDTNLQNSPYALELAWARVMQKHYAEPDTLSNDQNFINEKILVKDEVKKQVLEEYFKNLNKVKTPPVIASFGNIAEIKNNKAKSMEEAKHLVEQMFNIKG